MLFAALILLIQSGCDHIISTSSNDSFFDARINIENKVDATISAQWYSHTSYVQRAPRGFNRYFYTFIDSDRIEFEGQTLQNFYEFDPYVRLSNRCDCRIISRYCNSTGVCQKIELSDEWKRISVNRKNQKDSVFFVDHLVILEKNETTKIQIDYTTNPRVRDETW